MVSEEEINSLKRLQWQVAVMLRDAWLARFEGAFVKGVNQVKTAAEVTKIKVDYAGIVTDKPYDGTLSINFVPDRRFLLEPGRPYQIEVAGLSFAETDTRKGETK